MRFGPKHNDIAPILGDTIRWRLGLPARRSIEARAVLAAANALETERTGILGFSDRVAVDARRPLIAEHRGQE